MQNTVENSSVLHVRVPDALISGLDAIVADHATGLGRVTRADVIRRALEREVAEHAPQAEPARARTRTR